MKKILTRALSLFLVASLALNAFAENLSGSGVSFYNSEVSDDEFKVAMKCGPMDYHFIRLDNGGWYNKSGTAPGLFIAQSIVAGDIWYAMWMNNGKAYYRPDVYNDDQTIYFAVKVGWDVE